MKILLLIILILFVLFLAFTLWGKKFLNPYKLYLLFGKKGVGKSTLLQKLSLYYTRKGYRVYCNSGDSSLPFVIPISINSLPTLSDFFTSHSIDVSSLHLPTKLPSSPLKFTSNGSSYIEGVDFVLPNSVIMCDEINLLWDNRDFKKFPKDMQRYFRLQRHYKHIFIGFSQTYDTDKKIRDLADELIIVDRFASVFITSKSYIKKVVVVSPSDDNSRDTAMMTDDFRRRGFLYDITSPFRAFLPYWCKKHNSYKL